MIKPYVLIISRVMQQHNKIIWERFLKDLEVLFKEYNLSYRILTAKKNN